MSDSIETLIRRIVREEIELAGRGGSETPAELRGALTQEELAYRACVSRSQVSGIETGTSTRTFRRTFQKLSGVLGIPMGRYIAAVIRVRKNKGATNAG